MLTATIVTGGIAQCIEVYTYLHTQFFFYLTFYQFFLLVLLWVKFWLCWILMMAQTRHVTLQMSFKMRQTLSSVTMIVMGQIGTMRAFECICWTYSNWSWQEWILSDDDLPFTTTPTPIPSTVDNEEPRASTRQKVQSEEPAQQIFSYLCIHPPTLREIPPEMSNPYSTQTNDKQLYLSMDEPFTFCRILTASGYNSVPRRHMYWSLDSDVHSKRWSYTMADMDVRNL